MRTESFTSAALTRYVVATYFPADAADWAEGQQLGAFEFAVIDKVTGACMQSEGFRAPPPLMNEFEPDNTEFPDLQTIASTGRFASQSGIPDPPDPTKGMSSAERDTYVAAYQRCQAKAAAHFAIMNSTIAPLEREWDDILSTIDATSPVEKALRQFNTCSAKAGVERTGVLGFLDDVDAKTVPLLERNKISQAAAIERHLAKVFARCLGPAQALRVRLREQQRTAFFASHAGQLHTVIAMVSAVVTNLEHREGLRIPKVVPIQS